nr:immunoglobulin light chain junction region [Macaca mulatta]MOV37327.1 immunoglobulin light chain junction region [Macaca mulatta]MOV74786.1 immunoglobulin light chain junction region [Macaca mulatta]MOV74822.1 immunoglobulin light chain junction region [Macaca mulatta]MOV75017.1 immunoglobulin light chain junction region [Macaca mulatta]
CQHSYGTPLTF